MDAEQASNWAAAQAVGVGEDLVPAALRHIDFLEAVDRRRWLYEGPLLDRAIRRYPAISLTFRQHKRRLLACGIFLIMSTSGWRRNPTLPCSPALELVEKLI
jgi:hypothetical protein